MSSATRRCEHRPCLSPSRRAGACFNEDSRMKPQAGILLGTALALFAAEGTRAQTIYPLNRAEILSGSRFDLKVEFPGAPPASGMRVTINGADAASVVGKSAS